ncbi:MAG: hypothetical protein AAB613_01780 [Patescibacteria group bacterium]
MNKAFYWVAVLVAIALITLGVIASRKTPTQTDTNNTGDSFNADQLQDAAEKTPATNN